MQNAENQYRDILNVRTELRNGLRLLPLNRMGSWSHRADNVTKLKSTVAEPVTRQVDSCLARLSGWAAGNGQGSKYKLIKACNETIAKLDIYAAKTLNLQ